MLQRWVVVVLGVITACKGSHSGGADAGMPPDGMPMPDAPPDGGNACARTGIDWLPWVVTGPQPTAVALADFNRDGLGDLFVTHGDARLSVWLTTGGGRFRPGQVSGQAFSARQPATASPI